MLLDSYESPRGAFNAVDRRAIAVVAAAERLAHILARRQGAAGSQHAVELASTGAAPSNEEAAHAPTDKQAKAAAAVAQSHAALVAAADALKPEERPKEETVRRDAGGTGESYWAHFGGEQCCYYYYRSYRRRQRRDFRQVLPQSKRFDWVFSADCTRGL